MNFITWLDTFLDEKEIDLEDIFTFTDQNDCNNIMSYGVVVEAIKIAPNHEQQAIKKMLIKLDFNNASIKDYLQHLGKALVNKNTRNTMQTHKNQSDIPAMSKMKKLLAFLIGAMYRIATAIGTGIVIGINLNMICRINQISEISSLMLHALFWSIIVMLVIFIICTTLSPFRKKWLKNNKLFTDNVKHQ